jgi:hypothetical protein
MSRTLIAVCGVLAAFGMGLAAGHAVLRSPSIGPPAGQAVRERALKRETPHPTRAAAVSSASAIRYAFDLPTSLDPSRFESAIERVAAPGSEDHVRRLFGRGIEDVRAMFADRPRVSRATPVGYRILSFEGTRASVAIWNVAIGGSSLMTPVAQRRTIILDLTFMSRGWKATGGRSLPGPSAAATTGELARRAAAFNTVRHAP